MSQVASAKKKLFRCAGCTQSTPAYDMVNCGLGKEGYRRLCSQCFNLEVARLQGLDGFAPAKFEPVSLTDCAGEVHEFHFRTNLFGGGVALDAFELRDGSPGGYQFQIIGDPREDLMVLLARLITRIRNALSRRHLKRGLHGLQIEEHRTVRALLEWDPVRKGLVPLLIIDGRAVTWTEFGRMLTNFEGWQFKLTISDKSEEV